MSLTRTTSSQSPGPRRAQRLAAASGRYSGRSSCAALPGIGRRQRAGDLAAIAGIFGRGAKLLPRGSTVAMRNSLARRPGRRHHGHPLRQVDRLEHRMGDEDDGLVQLAPQIKQIVVEPKARDLVERRERLVQQRISGSVTSARASETRIFMPPDNSRGYASANSDRPTCASASSMRLSASAAGACESFSGRRTFSRTLAHGISVAPETQSRWDAASLLLA